MMSCDDAADRLLEADEDELDGTGSSELAAHVRGCAGCRELGRRILEGQEALSGALAAVAASVAPVVDPASIRGGAAARPRGRRRVVWRVAVPLAAAATAALALFSSSGSPPGGAPDQDALARLAAEPGGTVVAAHPDERVAVLPTSNPAITVVWFIK